MSLSGLDVEGFIGVAMEHFMSHSFLDVCLAAFVFFPVTFHDILWIVDDARRFPTISDNSRMFSVQRRQKGSSQDLPA